MKHTFRKCLSLVLALATLLSVCVVPLTAATECNHYNYSYTTIGHQDPTCTEYGGLLVVCNECNERYVRRETWEEPLGHDWVEVEGTRVEATIEKEGGYSVVCSVCGATDWVVLPALKCDGGCKPENLEVVITATCTQVGEKITTCKACGRVTKEDAPALGHAWNNGEVTVRPVCGESNGEVTFSCTRCEATYVVVEIAPADHEWKWFEENLGSCGVDGNTAGYKCMQPNCPATKDGYSVIDNPDHDYQAYAGDETHVNVAVGCQAGNQWYKCANANCLPETKFKNEQLTPTEHGNHQIKMVLAGTDPVTGEPVYVKFVSSCLGNDGGNGVRVPTTPATCFVAAIYSCSLCGAAISSPLESEGPAHTWEHEVDPTCTTFGYRVCSVCGGVEGYADLNGNPIPGNEKYNKLGHQKPTDPTLIYATPATCFEGAYIEYWCTRACCANATEMVKEYTSGPNPHEMDSVPHVDPTCTEPGVKGGAYCKNCTTQGVGTYAKASEVIDPMGHTWSANNTNPKTSVRGWVAANCMYAAHEGELCGECGLENLDPAKMDFTKNPNGKADETKHDWVNADDSLLTEPTCTKPGSKRMYCRICNKEHIAEVSALKHDWQNDPTIQPVGFVPATCYGDGYYVYFCDVCDTTSKGNVIKLAQTEYDRFDSHYLFPSLSGVIDPQTGKPIYTTADDYDYLWDTATQSYKFILTPMSHDAIVDLTLGTLRTENRIVGLDNPNTPYIDGYNATLNKGSCGVSSYYEWTCAHCAYTYNKDIEDQFGACGEHAGVIDDITMDCVTNTPGTDGRVVCTRCETTLAAGAEVPVWHDIDPDAATTIGKTLATCLTDGWTQYGVCSVCTAAYANQATLAGQYVVDGTDVYRWNEFVPALGHAVRPIMVDAQKVDCELPGWDAHYKCVRCDYVVDNTTIDNTATDDETKFANIVWVAEMTATNGINNYKDPTGHNFTMNPNLVPMKCTVDGYIWYDCSNENCSAVSVDRYMFGYYEHRYSDKSNLTNIQCAESFCLCQNMIETGIDVADDKIAYTITTALCLNKKVVRPADPHTNAAGQEILGVHNCAEWDKDQDHKCKYCNVNFINDMINHNGNLLVDRYDANCLDPKDYDHKSCTVCKQMWIVVVATYDPTKVDLHKWDTTLDGSYVAPTWTTDGSSTPICSLCNERGTPTVIAAPDLFFEMDYNNVYGGKTFVNGSFMALDIYVTGSNTNVHSINMSIPVEIFNGQTALEYIGAANKSVTVGGTPMIVDANFEYGSLELFMHVENTTEGELQNVVVNNKIKLVTLYFQVNPDFYDVDVRDTINQVSTLEFGDVSVLEYKEGNPVQVKDVVLATEADAQNRSYLPKYAQVPYTFTVYKLGDLNMNGSVTDFDAVMVEALVFAPNAAYNAKADMDQDGDVDLADFVYIKQIIVGIKDYATVAADTKNGYQAN